MYANSGKTREHVILWAFDLSAWSGKMRSYLIQSGIPFEERLTSETRFHKEIVPRIGYFAAPVIELPDGTLLQDSTEAIIHLEQRSAANRLCPEDRFEAAIAWMLNFFGSDGFHKPGMHYRWNFPQDHDGWIHHAFRQRTPAEIGAERRETLVAAAMQGIAAILPHLGVTEKTAPAIEQSWSECLELLQAHFSDCPFLLGDRPTVADCGLMTMVFAHLGRDPRPATLMKQVAPDVFRWTERMNRPNWLETSSKPRDGLPSTLIAFLAYLFRDYGPELKGAVEAYNAWFGAHGDDIAGALSRLPGIHSPHPLVTHYRYDFRGVEITRSVLLDTIYQYQYVTAILESLSPSDRSAMRDLLARAGGSWMDRLRATGMLRYCAYKYCF